MYQFLVVILFSIYVPLFVLILEIFLLLQTFINIYMKQAIQYFQLFCYIAGLNPLTNQMRGSYYGISKTWGEKQKKNMGVYFLKRALQIFKGEGENQLFYDNILKVGQ